MLTSDWTLSPSDRCVIGCWTYLLKGWIRNENVQVKNVVDIFIISEMNRNVRYIEKKK